MFKFHHNWLLEPSKSLKITAIITTLLFNLFYLSLFIVAIMFYIAYKETGLLAPNTMIDEYYPDLHITLGVMKAIVVLMFCGSVPMGYAHVCIYLCCLQNHALSVIIIKARKRYHCG